MGGVPGIGGGLLLIIGLEISPTKYGRQLNLDWTKKVKSIEETFPGGGWGDSLTVELASGVTLSVRVASATRDM